MDRDCLNTFIRDIQCKFKDFAHDTSKSLAIMRGDSRCKVRHMSILSEYIESLYYYVPFESDVTYAKKFEITRTDDKQITITIQIGARTFSHTGSGDAHDFVVALYNEVNKSTTPNYKAEFKKDTLYIYSTDTSTGSNVATSTSITQNSDQDNSISTTDIIDNLGEILNIWNCLKLKELCQIIDHSYDLIEENC